MKTGRIITVGLAPAWDIKCLCSGLQWGQHVNIAGKTVVPAGKALNVSKALAWMNTKNTAAGLWGSDDYNAMLDFMAKYKSMVKIKMTVAPGRTRENIWVVDDKNNREIHLRAKSELASKKTITILETDLKKIVHKKDTFVFAGAISVEQIGLLKKLQHTSADLVIDTSGPALNEIKKLKNVWLIKPNVDELRQMIGKKIKDDLVSIKKHCLKLLDNFENILVSRSAEGAILISRLGCWKAKLAESKHKPLGTVGCGDYLLAGFLAGFNKTKSYDQALQYAVIAGSARAFGFSEKSFRYAKHNLKIIVEKI